MNVGGRYSLLLILLMLTAVVLPAQKQIQVQWATYLGGSGRDEARDIDCDRDENAYVCGIFTSTDFPAPRGVSGPQDATGPGYLAKFSEDGALLWLMWFQGFSPHEVNVDQGIVAVVGSAAVGANTLGGTQPGPSGTTDVGLVLVSVDGERLTSTTIGGTRDDVGTSVDMLGSRVYVAGITASSDLPTTPNAPQRAYGGGGSLGQGIGDGVLAKYVINRTGGTTQLQQDIVSYYGGRYLDEILCVRRSGTLGEMYIAGRTRSDNLPGSPYISFSRPGDVFNDDGFAARLDSNLRPTWHMYVGGPGNDVAYSIQPNISINVPSNVTSVSVTVCGAYNGGYFQIPGSNGPSALDPVYGGGTQFGGDAFVLETSGFFNVLAWLQVLNTADDDVCVALPRNSSLHGLPLVFSNGAVGPFTRNNGINAYLWVTNFRGNRDIVEQYEGNADECILDAEQQRFGFGGRALEIGSEGEYFCGSTNSTLLPETNVPGQSFQTLNRGGIDGYIVRTGCSKRRPRLIATDSVFCSAVDTSLITFSFPVATAVWPDGSQGQSYVARGPGVVRVSYGVINGCDELIDSVVIRAGDVPKGVLGPSSVIELCGNGDSAIIDLTGTNIASVQWSGGSPTGNNSIVVNAPGQYSAIVTSADGCESTTNTVTVRNRGIDTTIRIEATIVTQDSISPGSRFDIVLRLLGGTAPLSYPDSWTASIRYNGSVLLPLFPINVTQTVDAEVQATTSGRRTFGGDTLAILPFSAALGETDSVNFAIDDIEYAPCTGGPAGASIPVTISGICTANGIKRFISTRSARLAITRIQGGTDQTPFEIVTAGSEAGVADAQLWSILGELIPLHRGVSEGSATTWRCASPLPAGAYVVVVRTNQDVVSRSVSIVR